MNLLILNKGKDGVRGVPDGSGPEGKGATGRRKGMCPLRENFESDEEYDNAMKAWKEKNVKKSILVKAKYLSKKRGPKGNWVYTYKDKTQSSKSFSGTTNKGQSIKTGQDANGMFYGEIKDKSGSVESATTKKTQNEVMKWLGEQGVEKVKWNKQSAKEPVKAEKKGSVKRSNTGTLPNDVHTLDMSNATSLIKQAVKMPLKTLRRNQDIVEQQKEKAYEKKNYKALDRLEVMGDIYTAAVSIKEFKDTTPKEWGEEIIGRISKMDKSIVIKGKVMNKSITVLMPTEILKAVKLSKVGVAHVVKGPTKVTRLQKHEKAIRAAQSFAEEHIYGAPKPDRPIEPKRVPGRKPVGSPHDPGNKKPSGMNTDASDLFNKEASKVNAEMGAPEPSMGQKTITSIVMPIKKKAPKPRR